MYSMASSEGGMITVIVGNHASLDGQSAVIMKNGGSHDGHSPSTECSSDTVTDNNLPTYVGDRVSHEGQSCQRPGNLFCQGGEIVCQHR
jgi:hypothetical protein